MIRAPTPREWPRIGLVQLMRRNNGSLGLSWRTWDLPHTLGLLRHPAQNRRLLARTNMVESLPTEVPAPTSHEVAACAFEAWADTFRSQGFKHRVVPLPVVRNVCASCRSCCNGFVGALTAPGSPKARVRSGMLMAAGITLVGGRVGAQEFVEYLKEDGLFLPDNSAAVRMRQLRRPAL